MSDRSPEAAVDEEHEDVGGKEREKRVQSHVLRDTSPKTGGFAVTSDWGVTAAKRQSLLAADSFSCSP